MGFKKKKTRRQKKNKIKKTYKSLKCAPKYKKSENDYTCQTTTTLKKIASNFKIPIVKTKNRKRIWKKINRKMTKSKRCENGDELCWLDQDELKSIRKELLNHYRPLIPEKWNQADHTWLTNFDIIDVMKQYEDKYKNFIFLGPYPIDFDGKNMIGKCFFEDMCDKPLNYFTEMGYNKIGAIFNLDTHDKSGSHWVALHCNTTNKEICYYDSYAESPPNEVVNLMDRWISNGKKMYGGFTKKFNETRFQYGNSECGVYCIDFIIRQLENIPFKYYINERISDETINKMRFKYNNSFFRKK